MPQLLETKPELFSLIGASQRGLTGKLSARYALHVEPGNGIRAAVTDGITGMSADQMDALPDLEFIAVHAVGYDKVDVAYAHKRGIRISNTPGVLTNDVADLAMSLMLAAARRTVALDKFVRGGRWGRIRSPALASSLSGRRVGILGLGRIGTAVARRAEAFSCEIGYHARQDRHHMQWRYFADLPMLAQWADILVVALAAVGETEGLINRPILDAIGPAGMIVNIARGSVINENDLIAALAEGRLGSAGLDVFADEPRVPEALIAMDQIVLSPHQGSATIEAREAMGQLVLDNLAAFFDGSALLTPVT